MLCGLVVPAWAQNSAARVMSVAGTASATDAQGRVRPIAKGADVYTGDRVVTAESGLVQMRLHDGGYISVQPGTEMVIDQFVHDEKDASQSSFLVSLLRGGFRSITGLIGRTNPGGYQIRTSSATVGIRGTDHEPMLILDTPGMLALKAGDIGFSPMATDTPPEVLLKIPNFYRLQLRIDTSDAKDAADGKPAPLGTIAPVPAPTPAAPATVAPATPLLTTEQKKAILQTITPTPLQK